jgi:hypothetical protein
MQEARKKWASAGIFGVTSQKATAVKTSNVTYVVI